MKNFKKITSTIAATLIAASLSVPMAMSFTASAATTVSLSAPSLPNGAAIEGITAYQIFTGTYTPADADNNVEADLTVTGWGAGINVTAFIDALKADSVFESAFAGVASASSATTAQAVADIVGKWSDNDAKAQEFARLAVLNKATGVTGNLSGTTVTFGDADTSLEDGYYVVTCSAKKGTGEYDSLSLGMLTVLGGTATGLEIGTGEAKVGLPEVMKKVKENTKTVSGTATIGSYTEDDTTGGVYNDVADYCIGDAVPFKLYGTMPANLSDYAHYYYAFTDTLGTQFDVPTTLTIKVGSTTLTATKGETGYTVTGDTGTNCRVSVAGQVISISFEDIKAYTGVTESTVVTVTYDAVLNNTAEIGLPGQENKVDLTYSNNPNFNYTPNTGDTTPDTPDSGTPETPGTPGENTGTTPEDKVIVFTYEADFTKVDGVTDAPLAGVIFQLKKGNDYAVVKDGMLVGWSSAEITSGTDGLTDITSAADGTFKVIGLDDGTYTLIEKTPLTGYNPIGATEVIITAGTVNNQAWSGTDAAAALTSFKYKVGTADEVEQSPITGIASGTIENKKGSTLPSTGGIGTTLFYVGGGCMVALAGIFLITKKRMNKNED